MQMTTEDFLQAFETLTLPLAEWTHQAHVRVAFAYVCRHNVEDATARMRNGIQSFNKLHGIVTTANSGYHETMTVAFVHLVHQAVSGPDQTFECFAAEWPDVFNKRVLLRFYSRDLIMSSEARASFVKPDLRPLSTSTLCPPTPLSLAELHDGLEEMRLAPLDQGDLKQIVIRPKTDQRVTLQKCEVSPEKGVHGDSWADCCWKKLPDGSPHPDVQVAIINSRLLALAAQYDDRWELAGDNLLVDFDLSEANLKAGQRLSIGTAVLEITDVPHLGCRKFAQRYGDDAVSFVNSAAGQRLRLRGVYARIVQAGTVQVGDTVAKSDQ